VEMRAFVWNQRDIDVCATAKSSRLAIIVCGLACDLPERFCGIACVVVRLLCVARRQMMLMLQECNLRMRSCIYCYAPMFVASNRRPLSTS
jgi:hypothetical protein